MTAIFQKTSPLVIPSRISNTSNRNFLFCSLSLVRCTASMFMFYSLLFPGEMMIFCLHFTPIYGQVVRTSAFQLCSEFKSHRHCFVREVTSWYYRSENETTNWPRPFEWKWVDGSVRKPLIVVQARSLKSSWTRVWSYRTCSSCWSHQIMRFLTPRNWNYGQISNVAV